MGQIERRQTMNEIIATIFMKWDTDGNGSPWHCGSLDGARRFVEQKLSNGDVRAYSIEYIRWMPIDDNDPDGQLYGVMIYHEYTEIGMSQKKGE